MIDDSLHINTYRYQTLPLTFIQGELAFDTIHEARDFLQEHRAGIFKDANCASESLVLDCKSAYTPLTQALEDKYRKVQIKGAV